MISCKSNSFSSTKWTSLPPPLACRNGMNSWLWKPYRGWKYHPMPFYVGKITRKLQRELQCQNKYLHQLSIKAPLLEFDIWDALRKKVPNVLLLVWHRLFFFLEFFFFLKLYFILFWKVSVIPKEGWTGYPSILLLVWQRLRTLGTFSHTTAHLSVYNIQG